MRNPFFSLDRRGFLLACLVGVGSIAAWTVLDWTPPRRAWIRRKLAAHFAYLDLEAEGIERFIAAYETHRHVIRRHPLKLLFLPLPEEVCLSFLASSDFFLHGGDESRVVHFVALHDPYVSPCFNPFIERES